MCLANVAWKGAGSALFMTTLVSLWFSSRPRPFVMICRLIEQAVK